ncbi:cerebellar degeneration-related protein 2-like isoform X1 [Onthophagus taurus]|uniref:cerebellar degeneration-related protein 2-like isoform X1 n=1 Tax=Onthophagus taurus TaxID=166361 RepID=UPI0039BDBCEB
MAESSGLSTLVDSWGDYGIELECLQGSEDLHLAAELGKTLLERNKELENSLKHQQNIIEDQSQEIEYLTKQTVALREVNDSRLRIYEQLEVNIQDLERANHRLAVENASDRKHIKSLTSNIETLETKCEQLQSNIDELTLQLEVERRKSQRTQHFIQRQTSYTGFTTTTNKRNELIEDATKGNESDSENTRIKNEERVIGKSDKCQETQTTPKKEENNEEGKELEQISQLMSQLREKETQCARDQRKITEVEEQLEIMQEQNKILERQLSQYHIKDEEIKSVQDELSSLEEVRMGQLCSKCLGNMNGDDNMSLSACDDDDSSMFEALNERSQFRTSYSIDVQDYNKSSTPTSQANSTLYLDLVQKYQALLEVHRIPKKQPNLSLQEELQMSGEFQNHQNTKDTDEESGNCDCMKRSSSQKQRKTPFSRTTPTDFSEAETSSSGFCDETFTKATQTDEMRLKPGSFLCTIGDGNDCIRIYDDTTSPIESRFRNRPEYRELFKEIFGVLNKASKNKRDDEGFLILDDDNEEKVLKVPPVTPNVEQLPDFPDNLTDDTQSIFSSSSQQEEVTLIENNPKSEENQVDSKPQSQTQQNEPQERVLTPLIRPPLESITVQVNVRKRSSSRKKKPYAERSDSPVTHIVGSPKVTFSNKSNGRRRRMLENKDVWKGNTAIFYNRSMQSPSPNPDRNNGGTYKYEHAFEFKPSPASQELHKLKTLERTYADVLRKKDNNGLWRRPN